MKRKCGLSPQKYVTNCPPKQKGLTPDNSGDCQGCQYSVETGMSPGYPINKLEVE